LGHDRIKSASDEVNITKSIEAQIWNAH